MLMLTARDNREMELLKGNSTEEQAQEREI